MKKISILGSTGSIGTQALEVLDYLNYEIISLAAGKNIELLIEQIKKYNPKKVCVRHEKDALALKSQFKDIEIFFGTQGLIEIASDKNNDILLVATSGKIGLKPTLAAIEQGIDIALANKETLVMAGALVTKKAKEKGVNIIPVDSEHSAIFQCLNDSVNPPSKLIITASGGPFLDLKKESMKNVKAQDALKHPRWAMGKKITIDSATLMNKGLEVIEAHYLFNMPQDKIEVVIHPQSLVHSFVEFVDGSMLAQIGEPSMHIPIQYALTYPKRLEGIKTNSFSLFDKQMSFFKPDFEKFKCLKLAYEALEYGQSAQIVLNAANEVAVNSFLMGKIAFLDIENTVEKALREHVKTWTTKELTLDDIFLLDEEVRKKYSV